MPKKQHAVIKMTERVYRVIISTEASDMLLNHIEFLANVSVSAARTLKNDLLAKIKNLEKTPYLYPVFYSDTLEPEYHKLIYKRYLVLYAIDEKKKTVSIEFVWDTRKDNTLTEEG